MIIGDPIYQYEDPAFMDEIEEYVQSDCIHHR